MLRIYKCLSVLIFVLSEAPTNEQKNYHDTDDPVSTKNRQCYSCDLNPSSPSYHQETGRFMILEELPDKCSFFLQAFIPQLKIKDINYRPAPHITMYPF